MARSLGISTTDSTYFDYLRIAKSQSRGKALQRLQRKLEEPLLQTTAYLQVPDNETEQLNGKSIFFSHNFRELSYFM